MYCVCNSDFISCHWTPHMGMCQANIGLFSSGYTPWTDFVSIGKGTNITRHRDMATLSTNNMDNHKGVMANGDNLYLQIYEMDLILQMNL